jgi:hypothetical protein
MNKALKEIAEAWEYGYGMDMAIDYAIGLIDSMEDQSHETIETMAHLRQLKEKMNSALDVTILPGGYLKVGIELK